MFGGGPGDLQKDVMGNRTGISFEADRRGRGWQIGFVASVRAVQSSPFKRLHHHHQTVAPEIYHPPTAMLAVPSSWSIANFGVVVYLPCGLRGRLQLPLDRIVGPAKDYALAEAVRARPRSDRVLPDGGAHTCRHRRLVSLPSVFAGIPGGLLAMLTDMADEIPAQPFWDAGHNQSDHTAGLTPVRSSPAFLTVFFGTSARDLASLGAFSYLVHGHPSIHFRRVPSSAPREIGAPQLGAADSHRAFDAVVLAAFAAMEMAVGFR